MGKQREGGSMTNGGRHKKRKKEEREQRRRKGSRMETPRKKGIENISKFLFLFVPQKGYFLEKF